MIKKITVAGIEIDDDRVPEALQRLDRDMETQSLYVIEEVTMRMLLEAADDETAKMALTNASMTVIGETGVLEAASRESGSRKREIEKHGFFYGFMGKMTRGHKNVFVIGEKVDVTERFTLFLAEEFPRLQIVGVAATQENIGDAGIVNEANAGEADVVICIIPYPSRADFLLKNKDMFSASLWYGMEPDKLSLGQHRFIRWCRRLLHKRKLVQRSQKGQDEK